MERDDVGCAEPSHLGCVAALAGRRIDGEAASEKHFPLARVPQVRTALRNLFVSEHVSCMVSSAACGADLVALDVASELSLRRRVVLPFSRARFRVTSVTDRPGDWGALYDRILDEVAAADDLVVLPHSADDERAYVAANHRILDEAAALVRTNHQPLTVLVWDGVRRLDGDLTAAFLDEASRRGYRTVEVLVR